MKASEHISGFLEFLRECEENYSIAIDQEQDANNETQDILNRIELYDDGYHDMAKLVKALKGALKNQRVAKDKEIVLEPIVLWTSKHDTKEAVKRLEQLLGDVRKAEAKTESRGYIEKTDIIEEVLRRGGQCEQNAAKSREEWKECRGKPK